MRIVSSLAVAVAYACAITACDLSGLSDGGDIVGPGDGGSDARDGQGPDGAAGGDAHAPDDGGDAGHLATDVARDLASPGDVAVDAQYIYFTSARDGGAVERCPQPRCDGAPELVLGGVEPRDVRAADGKVAWVDRAKGTVMMGASVAVVDPRVVATGQAAPNAVDLSAQAIVWSSGAAVFGDVAVAGCPLAGCATLMTPLSRRAGSPAFVRLQGADAVWSSTDGIAITPLAGDGNNGYEPRTIAGTPGDGVQGLAMDATSVYFTRADGTVRSVRRTGDGPGATLAEGQGNAWSIAVDERNAYFTVNENAGRGSLRRVPLDGGAVEILLDGLTSPTGVALDADAVYVAITGDGRVVRVAKGL